MKKSRIVGCLIVGLLAGKAINVGAGFAYWDPEGTYSYAGAGNKGTSASLSQTWENAKWSTVAAGSATGIAWPTGDACVFATGSGGNTPAFTVTMNANHTVGGFFIGEQSPNSCNATVTGTGTLSLASGDQGLYIIQSGDGVTGYLTINNVIAGSSLLAVECGANNPGQIFLNGANTWTGGLELGYAAGNVKAINIVNFGNNAAFGAGSIYLSTNGSGSALVAEGSGAYTIANPITTTGNTGPVAVNFVGTTSGVTYTGNWTLNGFALNLETGGSSSVGFIDIVQGVISGTAGLTVSDYGTLQLTGVNTFTGTLSNVSPAVLTVASSGSLGSGNFANNFVNNSGATFNWNSSASQTLANISGGGAMNVNGTGVLTLGGSADNVSTPATINNGAKLVLNKTSASAVHALGGATTVNSGGTLQLSGSGGYEIYSGVTVTVASGGLFDMNSQSLTAAGITKLNVAGTGISSSGALINSTTTATSTLTCSSGIAMTGNASIGGSGNITLPSVISGSGFGITKIGAGTLTLSGANSYTGGTTVSAGTLYGSAAGSIPGNNVTNTGGVLELGSSTAMSSGATLYLASSPASGAVNLNFSGTQNITAMNWGTTSMAQGTWGSTSSSAAHQNAAFIGAGLLNITSGGTAQTITFPNPGSQTYGVAPITLTATAPGGAVTYTVTSGPASVAGSQLTITGAGSVTVQADQAGTTTINAAAPVLQTFTVNQAPATVTANAQNTPYGTAIAVGPGNTQFTANMQYGETIGSVTLSVSAAAYSTNTPAGIYTLTPSAATGGTFNPANYSITYATNALVVQPVALSVTASSESKNYGQTYTGVGAAKTTNFTATGLVNGVTTTAMTVTLAASGSPTGDLAAAPIGGYTLTPSAAAPAAGNAGTNFLASDYTIAYNTGTLTVSLAPATVTANAQTITYGTVVITNGSTAFTATLSNGETIGSVTLTLSDTNVGTNIITPSAATGGSDTEANYTITYVTNSLIVNPLPVVLTGTRAYDGTNDATNTILSVSNVVGGDDISVDSGSGVLESADIGTNAITSVGTLTLGGAASNNYTLTGASGSVIVTTLPVVLTGTRLYDGTTNASSSILSVANAASGDDVSVASGDAGLDSADVGTNDITSLGTLALGGTTATNYTLTGASGSVTVTPLSVVLTGTRPYDGTALATNTILTVANAFAGDDVNVTTVPGSATLASSWVGSENITDFSGLTLSGVTGPNYSLTSASGAVTITDPGLPFSIISATVDNTGTNIVLVWNSIPGDTYQVKGTTNLLAPQNTWTNVGGPVNATSTTSTTNVPVLRPTVGGSFFDVFVD